ncbi:MAG TPA: hypothetical protein VK540_02685 [Polyangiaceae bacterium]|jgi:hypothetical protein|nr:hypothetical protein [Polyangiaceae bacterium]
MSKSPAAIVKQQFGDKAKLVAALGPLTSDDLWLGRINENKGLARVSNAKLLRLFGVLSAVKEKFGTRAKLVDAICEIEKRVKDEGFKKRLLAYPVPRLYDAYRSAAKRAGIRVETKPVVVRSAPEGETPKAAPAKTAKQAHAAAKSAAKKKAPAAKAPAKKKASSKKSTGKKKSR